MFGHDPDAIGIEALEKNGSAIRPQAGQLIFFDGKTHPHYARIRGPSMMCGSSRS